MKLDRIRWWGFAAMFAGATTAVGAVPAGPGVVNFIEGQMTLNGNVLSKKAVGETQMGRGAVLETSKGRAEILLSPGVFLRLGEESSVRLVSDSLLDTRLELLKGNALVEAAQLKKENEIRILDEGSQTTLLKDGLYRFNADRDTLAVYDGKARVMSEDQTVEVKSGHEVSLNGPLVDQKFDKKATRKADPLYAWSKLRSEYLSEASASTARTYIVNDWGWPGAGFYWNPWFRTYTWLPGNSIYFSRFGAPYYSPWAFRGFGFYGPRYYPRVRPRVPGRVVRPRPEGRVHHRGINPGLVKRSR
jgi:hypothetical protein